jgi:hypothetical protein
MMNPGALILISVGTLIGGVLLLICVTELVKTLILRRAYWRLVSGAKTRTGRQRPA